MEIERFAEEMAVAGRSYIGISSMPCVAACHTK